MNRRVASPSLPLGPHTNVVASPGLNSTTPSRSLPIRSFGPGRSCRIATWRPARPAASRTRWATSACSSALPWEKFSRATSIPASTMRTSISGSRDAGPMVATILVRRIPTPPSYLLGEVDVPRECERRIQLAAESRDAGAHAEDGRLLAGRARQGHAEAPVRVRLEALDHLVAPARQAAFHDDGLRRVRE